MIRLVDLLEDVKKEKNGHSEGEVWVCQKSGHFGAKNGFGDVRYFIDREKANKFAHSHSHHPHDVQHRERKQGHIPKQTYDVR